jgi:hypothetical protein
MTSKHLRLLLAPTKILLPLCASLSLLSINCSKPDDWRYQAAIEEDEVTATPADLGIARNIVVPVAHYGRGDGSEMQAMLPTGLAVVQVVTCMNEEGHRNLRIVGPPTHRGVYWNQLLDDMAAIREVALLHRIGLDPRGTDWRAILRDAAEAECGLCVIYCRYNETDADAEYWGVLFDSIAQKPLVSFSAPFNLRPPVTEEDHGSEDDKIWACEADVRAETKLRQLIRDSVWDFAAQRGRRDTTTQPNPWNTGEPLSPRNANKLWDEIAKRLFQRP